MKVPKNHFTFTIVKKFFSGNVRLPYVILICLVSVALTLFGEQWYSRLKGQGGSEALSIMRDQSNKFTKPVRYFDIPIAASRLKPLNAKIEKILSLHSDNGELSDASVYLRNLETGEWTSINDKAAFHPGSLIKVPMLLYYLKASEKDPEVLNKKLMIPSGIKGIPSHTYAEKTIELDKEYTVRELLKYMASYSDNRATFLLNNNCDIPTFQNMFQELGLAKPEVHDTSYAITVKDFSIFMRVLYNSTYLNTLNSDYALNLLSESSFDEGLKDKLPANILVARKFGEANRAGNRELHESGIVYCENKPYLLIVMSKGFDVKALASMISDISESVFKHFCI
jgi:beta-lactamase class A